MPYQIQLKRKDGTIFRADFKISSHQTPLVGDIIECPVGDQVVRARVSAVRKTSVGANSRIRQPVDMVVAEEV